MKKATALDFLCRLAEGIAQTFGSNCETLVHDMSKPDHPILAIYNGHVSGRVVGSTVDILGSQDDGPDEAVFKEDFINHLVVTSSGQYIKSTTVSLKGQDFHYALGINFDFTALRRVSSVLDDITSVDTDLKQAINTTGQLSTIFENCLAAVGKPILEMKKADRERLIAFMKSKGAFKIQKSVPYVARRLNVSRSTIYHYLNSIDSRTDTDEVLDQ
jgi:predicted transcriptional regulator YheO